MRRTPAGLRGPSLVAVTAWLAMPGCGGHDPRHAASREGGVAPRAAVGATDESADGARMVNPEPPFQYPAALYARQVQGNVVLRLYVDAAGRVHPESTRVAEPSGYAGLDSAAVSGSEALRFHPAVRGGRAVGAALLFPVHFRHPQGAPLPGDRP